MKGLSIVAFAFAAAPALASGPYAADDAAITPAGERQIETWLSLSGAGHIFAFVPAFTPRALPFLELSVALDRTRLDGAGDTGVALAGKALLTPEAEDVGDLALAISGGARFGSDEGGNEAFALGIATLRATSSTLLHLNLGWSRFVTAAEDGFAWAFRAEQALMTDRLHLHAEVFGRNADRPGAQIGLRPTIAGGRMDLEFVFGRNLARDGTSWVTLGAAFRF